ncbi:MAG: glycoside hydrolase family 5 protein [Oscillospiraceae bacterium]|nr:glycoside hydrolase family 5 protein [Oscillospiraceae bacterium]
MKKLLSAILPIIIMISMTACSSEDTTEAAEASDATVQTASETAEETQENAGGFTVSGTKLLDANGNEFVFRGINHAHSWFPQNDGEALQAIADTGANCVRIVLANGIQWTKDSSETITSLIEKCKALNMIAIVEVHDGTGDDSLETIEQICDYWIEVKDALIGTEDYVILNIANEWVGTWDSTIWRDGYVSVIPKLREAGIKNTLMVDAAGWGQYSKSIADYGAEVFAADPDANTMFSIHMYGSAGKNESTIKSGIEGVTSQNLCVCVGEFGYKHSDGDVDEAYIMQYCTENDIGYLGWSWKGNGGGVEYLDISESWDGSVLSADWGEVLINGENGIKATSEICSVFE